MAQIICSDPIGGLTSTVRVGNNNSALSELSIKTQIVS